MDCETSSPRFLLSLSMLEDKGVSAGEVVAGISTFFTGFTRRCVKKQSTGRLKELGVTSVHFARLVEGSGRRFRRSFSPLVVSVKPSTARGTFAEQQYQSEALQQVPSSLNLQGGLVLAFPIQFDCEREDTEFFWKLLCKPSHPHCKRLTVLVL